MPNHYQPYPSNTQPSMERQPEPEFTTCGARRFGYKCQLSEGHSDEHVDAIHQFAWPDAPSLSKNTIHQIIIVAGIVALALILLAVSA